MFESLMKAYADAYELALFGSVTRDKPKRQAQARGDEPRLHRPQAPHANPSRRRF